MAADDAPLAPKIDLYRIPSENAAEALPAKEVVGSKGHNLMRMARRGLPVPAGFVIGTDVCRLYMKQGPAALAGLPLVIERELRWLGEATGRYFGDARRPLLVSVRSGAAVSMPGMMETVLNIGLNRATLRGLVRQTGNPRLAEDCRGRLVQQYGEVVRGISPGRFEAALNATLKARAVETIDEIDTAGMAAIADAFEEVFAAETGEPFPVDPFVQLREAVEAVLRSWSSDRAARYRRLNAIPDDAGTAVTVQAMAFGNRGPESGAGVGFTRNPADGRNELYVDYLPNAQGEDVVAGRRKALGLDELERRAPEAFHALVGARHILETEFCDMEDFEFTVEDGHLQFLQARSGKRTPLAAVRIASDLVEEQLITRDEALARIAALDLDAIDDLRLRVPAGATPIVRGTAAGTGVAVGALVFDPDRLAVVASAGRPVILVRQAAETADIASLAEAAALVTVEGARTSHAAVVARQLGKVCVVACDGLVIDPSGRSARFGTEALNEGDVVSVDGVSGEIYRGALEIDRERPAALLERLALWRAEAAAKRPPQA